MVNNEVKHRRFKVDKILNNTSIKITVEVNQQDFSSYSARTEAVARVTPDGGRGLQPPPGKRSSL